MATRETLLADTFLILADNLVDDFDPIEGLTVLAEHCVARLGATAAGIMVVDACGALQVIAESSEQAHVLELFQIQNSEGPCLDAFRDGRPSSTPTWRPARGRKLGPAAIEAGLRAVHAFPMRLAPRLSER